MKEYWFDYRFNSHWDVLDLALSEYMTNADKET